MDDGRNVRAPHRADEAVESRGVVEVAVAEDDHLGVFRIDGQAAHVAGHAVRTDPGVEDQMPSLLAAHDGHERGEAVLGTQWIGHGATVDERCRNGWCVVDRRGESDPVCGPLADEQRVAYVVDKGGDVDRIDRLERDDVGDGTCDVQRRNRVDCCRGIRITCTHDRLLYAGVAAIPSACRMNSSSSNRMFSATTGSFAMCVAPVSGSTVCARPAASNADEKRSGCATTK